MTRSNSIPMRLSISELTKRVYACTPVRGGADAMHAESKVDLTSDFNQCVLMLAASCGGGFTIRTGDKIWDVQVRERPCTPTAFDPTQIAILDYMKSIGEPVTAQTLSLALSLSEQSAHDHLRTLQKQHLIEMLPTSTTGEKHMAFVIAGQITPTPSTRHPLIDEAWRNRLLDARPIHRDRLGWGHHPELLDVSDLFQPTALYAALGIELHIIEAQSVLDDAHIDKLNMQQQWATWNPSPPEGQGWKLVAIFDTPDSPVAWFMRLTQD